MKVLSFLTLFAVMLVGATGLKCWQKSLGHMNLEYEKTLDENSYSLKDCLNPNATYCAAFQLAGGSKIFRSCALPYFCNKPGLDYDRHFTKIVGTKKLTIAWIYCCNVDGCNLDLKLDDPEMWVNEMGR